MTYAPNVHRRSYGAGYRSGYAAAAEKVRAAVFRAAADLNLPITVSDTDALADAALIALRGDRP